MEVTPLLLPVSLSSGLSENTELLLELFNTHTNLYLGRRSSLSGSLRLTGGNEGVLRASSLTQEGVRGII